MTFIHRYSRGEADSSDLVQALMSRLKGIDAVLVAVLRDLNLE